MCAMGTVIMLKSGSGNAASSTSPPMTESVRFWLALDRLPGPASVEAHWRVLLGGGFDAACRFFTLEPYLADSYPRLDTHGAPYTVVQHGADDFVGICEEDGERVNLTRQEVLVHRI